MRYVLCLLLSLLLAQPAAAATVTARFSPGNFKTTGDETSVTYLAADGEANRLTVHADAASVRFVDEVPIAAGEGCDQVGEREALCHRQSGASVRVTAQLGDGDDRATVAAGSIRVHGGPGADALVGGPDGDALDGGPGADALEGGGGDDLLEVTEGAAGEGADRLDGGSGTDRLSFIRAPAPASADLAAGSGSLGGQALALAGLEELEGGPGDDRLLGGPGDDRIYGYDGDDVVDGRAGDDRVTGGGGRDTVSGGPGDDVLERYGEEAPYAGDASTPDNRFACGSGRDEIQILNARDSVGTDCERFGELRLLADPRRGAAAHLALPRSTCRSGERCRETLRLDTVRGKRARPRTRLLTLRYDGPPEGRTRRVRLDREARATLRRQAARHLLVRYDGAQVTYPLVFMIRLRS